jgi:arginine deiminase
MNKTEMGILEDATKLSIASKLIFEVVENLKDLSVEHRTLVLTLATAGYEVRNIGNVLKIATNPDRKDISISIPIYYHSEGKND